LDEKYKGTAESDQTGRFIPYWVNRPDGSVTVEPLIDYETPVAGDWYLQPRATGKEYTIAPLIYPVAGVDTVMATFTVPILVGDKFYGITGVDAPIAFVQDIVDNVVLYEGKAVVVLLTDGGTLIAVNNSPNLMNQPATELYKDFDTLQSRLAAGEVFISLSPDGKELRVFSPIEIGEVGTHWSLSLIIPFSEITAAATASTARQVAISIGLIALALFILWLLNGQVVRPIRELTKIADAVSQGNLNVTADVRTSDETGLLARAFNKMTTQLRELLATLEQRVAERTRNLELAAQVGRSVSQVRALDVMLRDACDLIQKEFDLYYVQVYLTDPSQTNLILEAGTGEVGVQLLARGHSLALNTNSINGRAAVEKRSVVIPDTALSATFRPNPLLPDTRGEMAVPLIVAEKVVGVLDMQDRNPGKLTEEVLPAFEALAGQLAVAIQNANLLKETEQARAEVEAQARRLVRSGWTEYMDAVHKPERLGFMFDRNEVVPLDETSELPQEGQVVSAPISLTGEMLGSLVVEIEDETRQEQTSELVNIVVRQVAQQIENLRLLESAERYRFEAEQAARRQTREGWKEYINRQVSDRLGFIYDLTEVRPYSNGKEDDSAFTLPLKVRDEAIGKLAVQGLRPEDDQALELVNAVADRLSAHIESLRQYGQTQSALSQSEKLFDASRQLTQATDLQELVAATVETLEIPVVNRALLTMFEYDAEGNIEHLTVIGNWWNGTGHEVTPVGTRYPLEVVRAMPMFVSPTPVFFNDAFNDPRVDATTMDLVKKLNLRAVAVLPLHTASGQLGALILEAEALHNFTPDEIRLFTSLAPQISTVVENRQQYEKAQHQAQREAMLNAINQKIQSATSVEAVLQIAARELGHALGAPMTIAQLSMKDQNKQ
jgi:GAF domain-containing protein/HAMP domain-containing protein